MMTGAKDDPAQAFQHARPALLGMAYRMLGTRTDAEDVVQDVFLRWAAAERTSIRNPAAWMMTVCTRRSIDVLRSAERSRIDYVGPWLPEPLEPGWNEEPQELSFALETAFLMVLERASAKERAAFLLHDIFGLAHAEVASTLNVTVEASRKLASRARQRVSSGQARHTLGLAEQRRLLAAFQDAIMTDDMTAFAAVIAQDVQLIADGGGKATALDLPLEGRDKVTDYLVTARNWWRAYRWREVAIGTGSGFTLFDEFAIAAQIWFAYDHEARVSRIFIMRNPDKLSNRNSD